MPSNILPELLALIPCLLIKQDGLHVPVCKR